MWIYRVRYQRLKNYSLISALAGSSIELILSDQGPKTIMSELRRKSDHFFFIKSGHSSKKCNQQVLAEGKRLYEKEIKKLLEFRREVVGPVKVETIWMKDTIVKRLFENKKLKRQPIKLRKDNFIFRKCVVCRRDPTGQVQWLIH